MRGKNTRNMAMVADDDMFVHKVITDTLMKYVEVTGVDDGADVLKTYMRVMPDILFLDFHLPSQSGLELLDGIRAFDPDAFIVMLSADGSFRNINKTRDKGVAGFLTKPFQKQELIDFLRKCPTIQF